MNRIAGSELSSEYFEESCNKTGGRITFLSERPVFVGPKCGAEAPEMRAGDELNGVA